MPRFNGTPGDDILTGTSGDDDLHGGDSILVEGMKPNQLHAADFAFG